MVEKENVVQAEIVYQVQFLMNENSKITIKTEEESFAPLMINFQVFDKNGIQDYTIFGFFTYSISEFLDIAFFNENVDFIEDDYKKEILGA